jgi:chlorophyllide a hydrolase
MSIAASVWYYWLVCGLATMLLWVNWQRVPSLLSPTFKINNSREGYVETLMTGWITTVLTALVYILFTHKQAPGAYQLSDLIAFSFFNGVLEQLMFVVCFLLGCWLGYLLKMQSWQIFVSGFLSFSVYAGLIHGLFWMAVLPSHQIVDAIGIPFAVLILMSFVWMQLFWRYQAVLAIIAMHIFLDFLSIGHLHFSWFDAYQLI